MNLRGFTHITETIKMCSTENFVCALKVGRQVFNFQEKAASRPGGMGWKTSSQRFNLALNLLEQVIPDLATVPLFKGKVSQRTLRLAPLLAEQILSGLPPEGGTIPYEFIVDWIEITDQNGYCRTELAAVAA